MPRKPFLAIFPETLVLIGMLRALDSPDKLLTKEDARKAIGREPGGLINTAKKHLLLEDNILIEWDRNKGAWRRIYGEENIARRKAGIKSTRHKAHRELSKLGASDFINLSDSKKIEATALASCLGAVAFLSTTPCIKRLEGAIQKASAAGLPVNETLALFHEQQKTPDGTGLDLTRHGHAHRRQDST